MSVTIVSEPHEEGMHPTLPQLVKAASIIGQSCTVIMPGGNGADEASKIQGVEKVIKLNGACFSVFDSSAWSTAISGLVDGTVLMATTPMGRELSASIAAGRCCLYVVWRCSQRSPARAAVDFLYPNETLIILGQTYGG